MRELDCYYFKKHHQDKKRKIGSDLRRTADAQGLDYITLLNHSSFILAYPWIPIEVRVSCVKNVI